MQDWRTRLPENDQTSDEVIFNAIVKMLYACIATKSMIGGK